MSPHPNNPTEFTKLKRRGKPPVAGDIFAAHAPGLGYLCGRVIRTDARVPFGGRIDGKPNGYSEGFILAYIYNRFYDTLDDVRPLTPSDLLIPPVIMPDYAWRSGRFVLVSHAPLRPEDVLEQHCFEEPGYPEYFDDLGNQLPGRTEPCGVSAISGDVSVLIKILVALGRG